MTILLKSQRLPAAPTLARGDVLPVVDYNGPVELVVSWPEPPLADGRWVHGHVGQRPATVWVTW